MLTLQSFDIGGKLVAILQLAREQMFGLAKIFSSHFTPCEVVI